MLIHFEDPEWIPSAVDVYPNAWAQSRIVELESSWSIRWGSFERMRMVASFAPRQSH